MCSPCSWCARRPWEKDAVQTNYCTLGCSRKVEHICSDSWDGEDSVQKSQTVPLSNFHFWMFHVCLGFLCRRKLFQRKKRSVSMKKKRTRKSLSKTKAKPFKFLAAKKSPAKKFAAKKKRQMPGYQATAPARPRGNFRVNIKLSKDQIPSRSSCHEIWRENLWWQTQSSLTPLQ